MANRQSKVNSGRTKTRRPRRASRAQDSGTSLLDGIIQSAMDAIITVDHAQRVTLFNTAAEAMFGCRAKEALGQPIDRFIPERFRERHREHIRAFGKTKVTSRSMGKLGTVFGLRANGEEFPLEASISQTVAGGKRLFTVILRDLTERKRVEEQLRRTERLAELGVLASGLAHEIGTPMNVILGRAEYLMQRSENEGTRKGLETIVRQVERITKIMNQLLAYARRQPAEPRRMDLRRTVEETLEMIQEKITKHGIVVETDFDAAVAAIDGDPDQISQLLLNLFLNAVHAMEEGGTLRISARSRQGEVRLSVSDTGRGIPREHLSKIFEPFFTTKEVGKGTGLGLNVVMGIIQEHRGAITVESEPGSGTTFTITLPTHTETEEV